MDSARQGRSCGDLSELDQAIRTEADTLLQGGLRDVLASYGAVHIVGSYALQLMVWRDLDVHLVPPSLDRHDFFEFGDRIAELLAPHRMQFRDERIARTRGLPVGLYWGVYLGDGQARTWKLDLWATDQRGLDMVTSYSRRLQQRISPESRQSILEIKAACWHHPGYRKDFGSVDVYEAVLEHGVQDVDGFWDYVNRLHRE